jgi:aminoglycoside N3'-acetyltransferase
MSETPFGDDSTYGRFSELDQAFLLLLDTNSTSIVHRFQEIVNMPNQFLPDHYEVHGRGKSGKVITYRVKVHTPRLPLYVALPVRNGKVQYLWMPDYCLLFPERTRLKTLARVQDEGIRSALIERDDRLLDQGVFHKIRFGKAEILAIKVKPWLQTICTDLRSNIVRYGEAYDPERIRAAFRDGAVIN